MPSVLRRDLPPRRREEVSYQAALLLALIEWPCITPDVEDSPVELRRGVDRQDALLRFHFVAH